MSSDPDGNTRPSSDKPQETGLKAKKRDIAARATANGLSKQSAAEYQAADEPVGEEPPPPSRRLASDRDATRTGLPSAALAEIRESPAAATALVRADHERQPKTGTMNGFDLWAYILDSRHRTINVVLILLALAVCIAAAAFGSHNNPVFTISLTSASTVATVLGLSAARNRKKRR